MTTDDEQHTEDQYERTKLARPASAAMSEVAGFNPGDWNALLGKSAEWWDEQDRKIAELKARDVVKHEQQRMVERAGELKDNGFPERFIALALTAGGGDDGSPPTLLDTTAMRHARVFVHLPKKLLVLAGGVGAGKTTAAAWVALKGADLRPGFLRAAELERRGRYDRTLDEWLKDKTSLVVDDIGAEVLDGKGVFRSLLDEIIDMFYGHRRTLVMTTNLRVRRAKPEEQEQFVERYGDRAWSRIAQTGVWGDCGTRDLRREPQP